MSNTITAYFKGKVGVAEAAYRYDSGLVMAFDGIYLPAHFDCYFTVSGSESAIAGIGADNRVAIPESVLQSPGKIEVHIPLHTGENDSEVEYVAYFKVIDRARPEDDGTPSQMTAIEQALALLQTPIGNIEAIVSEALSFTGETFDEMQEDLDEWKDDTDDSLATWKTGVEEGLDTWKGGVESDFDNLEAQFDTAVAAVTTDTEVTNIRVGDDNVTYTTAGEAVRTQFSNLKADYGDITKNLWNPYRSGVVNGLTISLLRDGCIYINGTASANTFLQMPIDLPVGQYTLSSVRENLDSSSGGVYLRLRDPDNGGVSGINTTASATQKDTFTASKALKKTEMAIFSGVVINAKFYIQLESGGTNTEFVPFWSAADKIARKSIAKLEDNSYAYSIIARGTDLNTLVDRGAYTLLTQTSDNPYLNAPTEWEKDAGVAGLLLVDYGDDGFPVQRLLLSDGIISTRFDKGAGFISWFTIKPINTAIDNIYVLKRTLAGIFHTIGVVGDSLASGQGRVNDYSTYVDFYDYSWPQCMKRILGNEVYNFTKTGLTTRTWLTDAKGYSLMSDGNHNCQCYIIGLGANDLELGAAYLGSSSDINLSDYTQNADTYYGNYAKIIQLIKELEPRAKIFTVENPAYGNDATLREQFNAAVRYMSTIFTNVYNIAPDQTLYTNSADFIYKNRISGHYTPAAYAFMAEYMIEQISQYIYDNPSEFFFVNLIGTEYSDPS